MGSEESTVATRRCLVVYVDEGTKAVQEVNHAESHYNAVGPTVDTFWEMLDRRIEGREVGPSRDMIESAFAAACWEDGLRRGDLHQVTSSRWEPTDDGMLKTVVSGKAEPTSLLDYVGGEACAE